MKIKSSKGTYLIKDKLVKGKYVVFQGKKFYPPYQCLCCGIEVSEEQFCYGRLCGFCDIGACRSKSGIVRMKGHNRKDIFENAEDFVEDELADLMIEKIRRIKKFSPEKIKQIKNENKNNKI